MLCVGGLYDEGSCVAYIRWFFFHILTDRTFRTE